jgi:hypothetical protein
LTTFAYGANRLVPSEYATIQAAINAAENNDVIIIADGVYTGPGNREIHFLGKAITVQSANGPSSCVVDCNFAGTGFYFDNNETSASALEGIAIRNIYDNAISTVNSSPTISNCVITEYAGISCSGGSPSIIGCIIEYCWNPYGQGALTLMDCNGAHITDCSITYGLTGIYGINSTADINGCIIKFNSAQSYYYGRDRFGGGIYWEGGAATIQNCDISNNTAHGQDSNPMPGPCPPGCDPGCIIPGGPPGCIPCDPMGCPPEPGGNGAGGGVCGRYTSLELINCLISGNYATGGMGGMGPGGGGLGGGIYCDLETTLSIHNSTITNNYAYGGPGCYGCSSGGGIEKYYYEGGGTATIENSIIWGNYIDTGGSGPQIGGGATGITVMYSDVGPEVWPGNMYLDPLFATGPLGDFYLSNTAAGQTYNSPCINAGNSPSSIYGLDSLTTSTDNYPDYGTVDMGYHYEISEQPGLVLLSPNGGETFIAGKTHTVVWDSTGAVRSIQVDYSTNNGSSWQEAYPANYGNTGSYQWTLPAVDSNQCLVRITDRNFGTATDTSNTIFTIFRCQLKGDLNGDCYVDLEDFAILSNEWLDCGNPFDPAWCTK